MDTPAKKYRLYLVDDDRFLLDMYAFKFSQNNFEVYTVMEGAQAIEKLQGGLDPDVVLMDIIMHGMENCHG